MTDSTPICSRCRKPPGEDALAVSLDREMPGSIPQELKLCPRCVESFRRWYGRRARFSSRRAANLEAEAGKASPSVPGSNQLKRRRRGKTKSHPVIRFFLVSSVTILLFLITFYWTWSLLRSVTRIDE